MPMPPCNWTPWLPTILPASNVTSLAAEMTGPRTAESYAFLDVAGYNYLDARYDLTPIQYNPQMFTAYDLLASAYETRGDIKKAIETYSGLLNYPVTQMPAHYQLALWYKKLGDHQEAKEHFESC